MTGSGGEFRPPELNYRTRARALSRMRESSQKLEQEFDLLVIGGGITGCGVAHDAASRGLRVALVEARDFASGTSSKSSKLIHGGLRYLENLELGLVFEALSERAFLLKTAPHLVKPLAFYLPIYDEDRRGRWFLGLGLWVYDLLAKGHTPEFHRYFKRDRLIAQIPALRSPGLRGGFKYYDASMWDDVMTVEVARAATHAGAEIATYTEVVRPLWDGARLAGVVVRDVLPREGLAPGVEGLSEAGEIPVRAKRVIVCAGPWTDAVGRLLAQPEHGAPAGTQWKDWLKPSKGVHLVFDLKRLPLPGALVMSHPQDGRIAFVIPRPDLGPGVTIVGTTDSPAPLDPTQVRVEPEDVRYLMALLERYFPDLGLQDSDILSSYAGVRPLYNGTGSSGASSGGKALRKVSREHHIATGPGGAVFVCGGKYTTYRRMAAEIVDFTLSQWKQAHRAGEAPAPPTRVGRSQTGAGVNPLATQSAMDSAQETASARGLRVPPELWSRYGAAALTLMEGDGGESRPGFPRLGAQLRYGVEHELVLTREDFERRRTALWAVGASVGAMKRNSE